MTRAELLAQADAADREADRLFEVASAGAAARTEAAKAAGEFFPHGAGYAYGECQADNVARACDLRREASARRAEADATPEAQALRANAIAAQALARAKSSSNPGTHSLPVTPPPPFAPLPAAGHSSNPKQEPVVDPVDEAVARILRA